MEPITTYTGRKVNPLDLKHEDICIEDIAHHLACINRFNGAAKYPISVAQHSVWVARLSGPFGMEGLLHDAAEAYLGDITKWLKETPEMKAYRKAEHRAQIAICHAFAIPANPPDVVLWADQLTVRFEHEVAFGRPQTVKGYERLTRPERNNLKEWRLWTWQEAEMSFLVAFADLKR